MAASVTIRVNTGASAGTESAAVSGIDLISADNATNDLSNRVANPVQVDSNSFEKWLTARVDVAPDNYVSDFEAWGDGAVQSSTTLNAGVIATGATPTSGDSSVATNDFTNYTSGAKLDWHATNLTEAGSTTQFFVLQLVVDADADAGNWEQETVNYSYNEA